MGVRASSTVRGLVVVASLCCPWGASLSAQGSPVSFPAGAPAAFEFSLSNPGARSLGLGGAFVALADDATAAFANPAGLVKLVRPEASIEGRHWSYSTPYVKGGRLSGEPTGILLDDTAGIREGLSEEEVDAISFASFVYPGKRWSVAIYHHQQIDFRSHLESQGIFGEQAKQPFNPRHVDFLTETRDTIETDGLSFGFQINDRWSVGVGVAHFDVELSTVSDFYWPSIPIPSAIYGEIPFDDVHRLLQLTIRSKGTDWGLIGGILWQPTEDLGFGAFYRQGPDVDLGVQVVSGAGLPGPPPGTVVFEGEVSPMSFPDVYGLGASYRFLDGAWTVSFEWDHVTYSSVLEGFIRDLESGGELDDADELHLGVEYAWLAKGPVVALRGGVWLDPDHQIRSTEDPETGDELVLALFREGEDSWHYAFGVGVAFEKIQVDLAADLSDQVDTLSLSAIFTF